MASFNPNNANDNSTAENAEFYHSSVEVADLGRTRFDKDVAAIGDRDIALTSRRPVIAPTGRPPRGMESAVHAWTTFQYTTDEVDAREELKGDLHGGQLHRENRAAAQMTRGEGSMWGGDDAGGGGGGGGGGRAARGGRGGRNAGREEVQHEGLCAGRKPDFPGPPMAKGMSQEMDKSMFWDTPILE